MVALALTIAACGVTGEGALLLEQIASVESGGAQYALHVNGEVELVHQPGSLEEAVAMAAWLLEHGHSFDAGLAQVNSANFGRLGLTMERLFDPCANLKAGLKVLEDCHVRAEARYGAGRRAEVAAISCYNTGDFVKGIRNGYVAAVKAKRVRAGAVSPKSIETDPRWSRLTRVAIGAEHTELAAPAGDVFAQDAARRTKTN